MNLGNEVMILTLEECNKLIELIQDLENTTIARLEEITDSVNVTFYINFREQVSILEHDLI